MDQKKRTLTALVMNRPGVLNRVVSLFRRIGLNLDSLSVGRTERPDVSRMTLVIDGTEAEARRVGHELRKLIDLLEVALLDGKPHVSRDLALIKVAVTPSNRAEVLELCNLFRGKIVDVAQTTVTIEATGDESKIEGLVDLLHPFGIVEMARTGLVALGRADHVLDVNLTAVQPTEMVVAQRGAA
ncbi:MAG: acetolactate synthase small subunit [bacterium]|nr:acetolactate synthase small subunit [bacterium]